MDSAAPDCRSLRSSAEAVPPMPRRCCVGRKGGDQFLAEAGEQIHDAARQIARGEHFAEEDRGIGLGFDARATTVLPLTMAGAMSETSASSGASSGASTPTMPIGSVTVKLK
jgi:hypothetical protein